MGFTDDDESDLERIRSTCSRLPHAEEAELQGRPLFRLGSRRFAIFNGDGSPDRPRWRTSGRSLHVATDPDERHALDQDRRFSPSPHHGHRGWIALRLDDNSVDWDEIDELLLAAYRSVAPAALVAILDDPRDEPRDQGPPAP